MKIDKTYHLCHLLFPREDYHLRAFLDISKAFDKVWDEGLIKLKQKRVSGDLLQISYDFLSNRKQRVVLNRQNTGV